MEDTCHGFSAKRGTQVPDEWEDVFPVSAAGKDSCDSSDGLFFFKYAGNTLRSGDPWLAVRKKERRKVVYREARGETGKTAEPKTGAHTMLRVQ